MSERQESEPVTLGQALANYSIPQASRKAESRKAGNDAREEKFAASLESWKVLKSAVGRRYADCKLENYVIGDAQQNKSVNAVREFVDSIEERTAEGRGLVFIGPPGTGKDHLAIACLRESAKCGLTVAWVDGQTLYRKYRDLIGSDAQEKSADSEYTSPDILLMSDPLPQFGSVTEHQLNTLWRIIDRRYRDQRPTWATLNALHRKDAETRLSPQIVDRLCDGARVVTCNWNSYRQRSRE